jgi:F420-non-reducing hydrogenase small subunit
MASKLKIAMYWGAGCGGCEVALLDTEEALLTKIVSVADIVFCPLAMDTKYADVEAMKDGEIDVCLLNGGVRNAETEHVVKTLRKKSKVVVAFGACACMGGVPGLGNQYDRKSIMDRVYSSGETTENQAGVRPSTRTAVPEGEVTLPEFFESLTPVDEVVDVDYYLPGCPPTPEWILAAVEAIASGELPAKGTVIGLDCALCNECPRERTGARALDRYYRPHEIVADPDKCLMEQGIICCGPATRAGCGARCLAANMPCRGCYGPPDGVAYQGAKMMSAAGALISTKDEQEIQVMADQVRDALGTFCQFAVNKKMFPKRRVA